jgi:hypothetical protein
MRVYRILERTIDEWRKQRQRVTISAPVLFEIIFALVGIQAVYAASLTGTVMNEAFVPLSGVSIKLSMEGNLTPLRTVLTDKSGVFTISDLAAGKYTVRATSYGYDIFEVQGVLLGSEDHHLRRILLETSVSAGNCIVRINSTSHIQHTSRPDIDIAGRVLVGHGEIAVVSLMMFAENEQMPEGSIPTDKQGRFRATVRVAGDIRLAIEVQDGSGRVVVPQQELNVCWAELGDSIRLPKIRLNRSGLGQFCY